MLHAKGGCLFVCSGAADLRGRASMAPSLQHCTRKDIVRHTAMHCQDKVLQKSATRPDTLDHKRNAKLEEARTLLTHVRRLCKPFKLSGVVLACKT